MSGDDPLLLVSLGDVAGKLENFLSEVVKHTSHVDGGVSSDGLVQTISLHQLHEPCWRKGDVGSLSTADCLSLGLRL